MCVMSTRASKFTIQAQPKTPRTNLEKNRFPNWSYREWNPIPHYPAPTRVFGHQGRQIKRVIKIIKLLPHH